MSHGRIANSLLRATLFDEIYKAAKADGFNVKASWLFNAKFNIDVSKDGMTPIEKLAAEGNHCAVEKLIRHGAQAKYAVFGYMNAGYFDNAINAKILLAEIAKVADQLICERIIAEAGKDLLSFNLYSILKWRKDSSEVFKTDEASCHRVKYTDVNNNVLELLKYTYPDQKIKYGFNYYTKELSAMLRFILRDGEFTAAAYPQRGVMMQATDNKRLLKDSIDIIHRENFLDGIFEEVYNHLDLELPQIAVSATALLHQMVVARDVIIKQLQAENDRLTAGFAEVCNARTEVVHAYLTSAEVAEQEARKLGSRTPL